LLLCNERLQILANFHELRNIIKDALPYFASVGVGREMVGLVQINLVDVLTVDHDTRKLLQEQSAQGIVVAFGQQVEKGTIHDGRLEVIAIGT
jgi:hypothetical protein